MNTQLQIHNNTYGTLLNWEEVEDGVWESHLALASEYARSGVFWTDRFRNKSIVLVFMNPSLRTRCSMELAARQLGAHVTTLEPGEGMWGICFEDGAVMDGAEAEHIREAAGVLSRYYDGIGIRVFATMKDYGGRPRRRHDQGIRCGIVISEPGQSELAARLPSDQPFAVPCRCLTAAMRSKS